VEHFRAPRNAGRFPEGAPDVARGVAGERRRGREIRLELKLAGDGHIEACRYQVYGCPATIALCSVLSERLAGQSLVQAAGFSGLALAEELQLPAVKRDAALLLEDALRAALAGYNMEARRASA
jgi:nitrogen fixation NifU-like protein